MELDPQPQPAGIGFRIIVILFAVGIAVVAFSAVNRGSGPRTPDAGDPTVTLIARNLTLVSGDDNAIRIGIRSSGSARLILRFVPDTARVTLCPLTDLNQSLQGAPCQADIFSGVRQDIATPGLVGIALVLKDGSAKGDLSIDYDTTARAVSLRVPFIAAASDDPACLDNGCVPFFEVTPVRAGLFTATATWLGSAGTLQLLQGSVLGRSLTATGLPYARAANANGASPLSITARLSAPAEYALVLGGVRGASATPLSGVSLDATWP